MEVMLDPGNGQESHHHRNHTHNNNAGRTRRSLSPNTSLNTSNPLMAQGPTIEELLSVKYDTLNDSDQTDIATTIRNAILIPTNLNVSDDCLRILCNRRAQEGNSLVLDTTADSHNSSQSSDSSDSEAISDQDLRCARELAAVDEVVVRRTIRQVSPLPRGIIISGTPILHPENSGNAVFDRIGDSAATTSGEPLSFNGRIPVPPKPSRPDHVVIQIEPDTSLGRISLGAPPTAADVAKTDEGQAAEEGKKDEESATNIEESFEFTNERSPDLFADDDDDDDDDNDGDNNETEADDEEEEEDIDNTDLTSNMNGLQHNQAPPYKATMTSAIDRLMDRDNHLLKRLQNSFSGVLPPPSVTNVAISLDVIVSKYREYNGQLPDGKPEARDDCEGRFLMKSVDTPEQAQTLPWPELKNVICHDVHYNLSSAIEQFEYLTVKYRSRFSGSDTASSFVCADLSSAKKRANRTKALSSNTASPGRRLSHLAKRRAIFSCANLQGAKEAAAQAQQAAVDLSRVAHRQILLPVRRGAKRSTPGKKRKTPGSSTKKRQVVMNRLAISSQQQRREALTRETSKRALFQSPSRNNGAQEPPPKPKVTPEVAIRVDKSKRALFSSPKTSFGRFQSFSGGSSSGANNATATTTNGNPGSSRFELSKLRYNSMTSLAVRRESTDNMAGKRKRDDYSDEDEENSGVQYNKVQRTESPRRSSIGSDAGSDTSFSGIGGGLGGSSGPAKGFMRSQSFTAEQLHRQKSSLGLPRTSSDMMLMGGTSKPVLALNEAEKKKLLWVVSQTLLRNHVDGKNPKFKDYATTMAKVVKRLYLETSNRAGSVTEQMNRLANNIAFQVIQNKSELEIYSAEKLRTQAMARKKLTGYVNSQEYEEYKNQSKMRRMSSGVFSDVSLSQCSVVSGMSMISGSGVTVDENFSQASQAADNTILRENVDTEQRQRLSAQKNGGPGLVFSGKDQKNVSPYSGVITEGGSKRKLLVGGAMINAGLNGSAKGLNVIKAKRQISFDA